MTHTQETNLAHALNALYELIIDEGFLTPNERETVLATRESLLAKARLRLELTLESQWS